MGHGTWDILEAVNFQPISTKREFSMSSINWADPLWELAARFAINTVAMVLLMFGMYYRRYRDKELATTASMFNIFAFSVLTILSSVEFSIAAGFGLFAILALFSLRSEQISFLKRLETYDHVEQFCCDFILPHAAGFGQEFGEAVINGVLGLLHERKTRRIFGDERICGGAKHAGKKVTTQE